MKISLKAAVGATVLLAAVSLRGSSPAGASPAYDAGWIGDYVYAERRDNQAAIFINFAVRLEGGKLSVDFNGLHAGGRGAELSGDGTGEADGRQTLRFEFEDDFGNKGTGTFTRIGADRYRLVIYIKETKDARWLVFYRKHILKRNHRPNFFVMAKSRR